MIARIRQWFAAQRLERITQERRNSFECEQYRRRRKASLSARQVQIARHRARIALMERRQRKESMG
jgi:hypothetical protein